MLPFGSVMLLLVLLLIGTFAATTLIRRLRQRARHPRESLPWERELPRLAAIAHAILFTIYWAALFYQHLMPNPWGEPNVILLLVWLPIFIIHMVAQFWLEARVRFSALDTAREREVYREGYADGRRDAEDGLRRKPLVRLTGEGQFVEDYPDLGEIKRKRGGEHDPAR
jgi:amino acid permease